MSTAEGRRTGAVAVRELCCHNRRCRMLLASIQGDVLHLPNGITVGPLAPHQVMRRHCPRCKRPNVFWLT